MNLSTYFLCFLWFAVSSAAPPKIEKAISVTTIEDTSATVGWDKPNASAGSFLHYNISISPRNGVNIFPPVVYRDRATRFLLSSLTPSTNYTLTIWTVDSSGSEGKPNSASFTTRPPRVASTIVSQITTTGANLSWERPNGSFDHYTISCYWDCTPNPRMVPANESNPHSFLSFTIPGMIYHAYVYTLLGTTSSRDSGTRDIQSRPVPVVPSSVSVSRISTISATIKWGQVITGEIDGYIIILTPHAGRSPFFIRDRRTSEMKLTELIPATKYNVTFQTYTSWHEYLRSDEVSIHFTTAQPDINLSSITSTNATALWTKSPATFDYYNITIERNQPNEITVNDTTVPSTMSSPSVKLLGLVPGNTYRVHVWTVNGSTNGLVRSSEWFQTKPAAVEITTISVHSVSNDSATLVWAAVTVGKVANYTFIVNPTHGGANAYTSVVTSYPWRNELRRLTAGTFHNITMRTNYGTMESDPVRIKFQTRPNPVDANSISLSEITTSSARVTWRAAPGNVDNYIIAVSGGLADPSTVANDTLTTTLKGLAAGRGYTVTIKTRVGTVDGTTVTRNFVTKPLAVSATSIRVSEVTTNTATLIWGAVTVGNVDNYNIKINPTHGGASVYQTVVTRYPRRTELRRLTAATEYSVTITSKYNTEESAPATFKFLTRPNPVEATSISFSEVTTSSARVTWGAASANIDSYIIAVSGGRADPSTVANDTMTTTLKGLAAGREYAVTIRARVGTVDGITVTKNFLTRPSAVKKSSIEVKRITPISATLTWGAVSDGKIDYYSFLIRQPHVSAASSATVEPNKVYPAPAWVISRTVALRRLTSGTEYTITIKTNYGQLESDPVEFDFTTELIPVDAASVVLTDIDENSAKFSWGSVDGNFDHYIISIRPTAGGAKAEPDKIAKGVHTTDLKNLTPGSFYIVTIRTVWGSKWSAAVHQGFQTLPGRQSAKPDDSSGSQSPTSSSPYPATTTKATTPGFTLPPTSGANGASISLSEITTTTARVTWRAAPGINVDNYIIAVSGGKADPSTVANDTLTTTLRGLSAGREYTVKIMTRAGTVDRINFTRNFVTRPSAVKKSTIRVKGSTENSATLTWGAVFDGNIDYYSILIRHSDGNATSNATVEPSEVHQPPAWVISRSVALNELTSGTEYTITIRTRYGSLESDPVEFNFTTALLPVDAASIILTDIDKNSAKVTWNSVDGNFDHYIISIRPTAGGAKVEPGQVSNKGLGLLTTDLKNLTAGNFYIVTIRTAKGTQSSAIANQGFRSLPDYNKILAALVQTSGSPNPATISHLPAPGFSLPPIIGLSMWSVAVACMVGWLE